MFYLSKEIRKGEHPKTTPVPRTLLGFANLASLGKEPCAPEYLSQLRNCSICLIVLARYSGTMARCSGFSVSRM